MKHIEDPFAWTPFLGRAGGGGMGGLRTERKKAPPARFRTEGRRVRVARFASLHRGSRRRRRSSAARKRAGGAQRDVNS